jgi:outer membrane protein OmpA-like peptidoglycan-associated protein
MKKLAYFFLFIFCFGHSFDLRGQFIADRFTNRPLTLMNDATSVGWNPAVLGMTGKTDVVLVVPYDRSWQNTRLIGAFASSQGVGLGYTSVRHERLPDISYVPFSFYGGVGSKIPGYNVWAGASFRYSEFGGRTVRYSGSLIYNPYDKLYLSAGMSNLYSVDTKDMVYQASATYSLLDWLTMHGRLQYCAENPIFWGEKYSSEFGIVAAINKKRIVSSFSVNPVAREARFGLEVAFDVFSIGVLSEGSTLNTPSGRFNGGNILLRVNHDSLYAIEHYRNQVSMCNTQDCNVNGCSGMRCIDAICPAYRCIKVDCPGKACSRSVCAGLNCTHGHSGKTILLEEQHTITKKVLCSNCDHPFQHEQHGYSNHHDGGCSLCGCKVRSHGIIEGHVMGQGSGSGSGAGQGSGSGSGAGQGSGSGSGAGQGSGSGSGAGQGTDSGSGAGQGSGTGSGAGQGSGSGSGAGQGTGTGSGAGQGKDMEQNKKPSESNDDTNPEEIDDVWDDNPESNPEKNNTDDSKKSNSEDEFPTDDGEGGDDNGTGDTPFEPAGEPMTENMSPKTGGEIEQGKPNGPKKSNSGIGQSFKLRRVFFDHDKWDIKPESVEELDKLQSYLTKNPNLCVRLDAHTDSNGSNEYNKELSRKRAQSVVDYLISKGTDPIRLSAEGFGEEMPVTTNDTPEGREENRRVEFTKMGC